MCAVLRAQRAALVNQIATNNSLIAAIDILMVQLGCSGSGTPT